MSKGRDILTVAGMTTAATVIGAGMTWGIGTKFYGHEATVNTNSRVVACANALGNAAMEAVTVPEPCSDYKDGFDHIEVVRVNHTGPGRDDYTRDSIMTYQLPPGKDFELAHLITPEDEAKLQDNMKKAPLVVLPFITLLGLSFGIATTQGKRRDARIEADLPA